MTTPGTLVAGIGNIFLGDDGFGVEVVRRLAERCARKDVRIVDFGIRGIDLAYALLDGYAKIILIDAAPRGRAPGTLYVLEPQPSEARAAATGLEMHGLVPAQALFMAQSMGEGPRSLRVVGCEPEWIPSGDELQVGLSPSVSAAVDRAVSLVMELLEAPDA
jgi:hydrogenase maturation protease